MTTFDLTSGSNAVSQIAPPRTVPHRVSRTAATPRARRRWFRGHSLWLQAVVFGLALGAGLFTGYLINR